MIGFAPGVGLTAEALRDCHVRILFLTSDTLS
jgi:hypothetical protein